MAPATVVRHENVDVELGVVPSVRPGSSSAATAPVGEFFSRLKQLLKRIIRATPQIICGGFGYFVLGRGNVQLDQLMIEFGDFSSTFPRFMWFSWFAFFVNDWVFGILFTTNDLTTLTARQGKQVMLVLSWGSITVSTVVLGLRLFQLRPMMRTLGFSYDAPEARKEENKALAKKALALDRKLGFATTFGEDFLQSGLTLFTAVNTDGLTVTMGCSLFTSVGASSYVVYDLVYKTLWNPDAGALIALFDATGGTITWKNAKNWKSHKPLSEWYGVTVDESGRVVKLELADNGLEGKMLSISGLSG